MFRLLLDFKKVEISLVINNKNKDKVIIIKDARDNSIYFYKVRHIFIKDKIFLLSDLDIAKPTIDDLRLMTIPDELLDNIEKLK